MLVLGSLVFCTLSSGLTHAATQNGRDIEVNQVVDISLPDDAAIVLLGNPEIADILVQNSKSIVIIGKRIGQTNLLVRNREQVTILDIPLRILPSDMEEISIFHGTARADYSCRPDCKLSYKTVDGAEPSPTQSTGAKP